VVKGGGEELRWKALPWNFGGQGTLRGDEDRAMLVNVF
jgi:hypothetical protein